MRNLIVLLNNIGKSINRLKWKNNSQLDGNNTKEYNLWLHMKNRCNPSSKNQITNTTHVGCFLYPDWENYDKFYDWLVAEPHRNGIGYDGKLYQLDKDLLFKGNKLYSPGTCAFIPKEINTFLTKRNASRGKLPIGVYLFENRCYRSTISNPFTKKTEHLGLFKSVEDAFQKYKIRKEEFARVYAEKYKHSIRIKCYQALMNFNVERDD